jgi:hypothetical protein
MAMNPIPRTFGILRFDGAEELDFIGPWETLPRWRLPAGGPANPLLVRQTRAAVQCAEGMSANPQVDFADCPPPDVRVVEARHVRDDTAGKLSRAAEYDPSSVRHGSQAGDAWAPAYVRNA